MYLKQTRTRTGRVRLAVCESYRDGSRVRQRTARSLGWLDELRKEHDDPVAWGREVALEMTRERDAARQTVPLEIHPAQRIGLGGDAVRDLGALPVYAAYSALGVERALRSVSRGSRASFDVNAAMRMLVCERVLAPGSKLAALRRAPRLPFRCDLADDDLYRALDLIAAARGSVVSGINRAVAASGRATCRASTTT